MKVQHVYPEVGLEFLNINPLNAELNTICHLLALLGGSPYSPR